MGADSKRGDRLAGAAFIGVVLLAGGNAVAIRFSNRELDPSWGATLRFAFAAFVLALLMLLLRKPWPRGHQLSGALIFGGLGLGVTFGLAYYALQDIHAGTGQTLLALVPLATLLIAVALRQEPLTLRAMLGATLAACGVAVISQASLGSVPTLSLVAVLGSVVSVALAPVLVRRFPPVDPVAMNAVAAATATVVLLVASLALGEDRSLPSHSDTWVAVLYLALVGTVGVFTLYLVVLKYWSASRAAYDFVLIPLPTVLLSAWLDNEPVGVGLLVGGVLVLGGVYLGALRKAEGSRSVGTSSAEQPEP